MDTTVQAKKAQTLDQLLTNEYGVNTHLSPDTKVVAVGVTVTALCGNSPNRVGLTFINLSGANIYVMTDNLVSASRGILLTANGGTLSLDWRTDFALVGYDWYALATGAASNLQVIALETQ